MGDENGDIQASDMGTNCLVTKDDAALVCSEV